MKKIVPLFAMVAILLSGCGKPFLSTLTPVGEVADLQYSIMKLSIGIMVFVILVVAAIFIYVITKFRRKDDLIPVQVEGSHKLEIIWTIIPIVLLVILAIPTVRGTFALAQLDPMKEESRDKNALVVNVQAHAFWWEFEYPDYGVITGQELVVPTDERVYFNLKASDVKHSFWIPAAGGKMDTNVEGVNQFFLTFDSERTKEAGGVLFGKCAELCGPSHALMDFTVKPISRADFDTWINKMKTTKKPTPKTELAEHGEEVFNTSCIACHAVEATDPRPQQARIAPNLANFADRNRVAGVLDFSNNQEQKEQIEKWLADPEAVKPGNQMTGKYTLTDQELDAVTEYLMMLKVDK